MASSRPIMPACTRSSTSTDGGSLAFIWWARRFTNGMCSVSKKFLSAFPLTVYMGALVVMSGCPSVRHAARETSGQAAERDRGAGQRERVHHGAAEARGALQ